ncbi:MAG TPA: NAD(P)H-binding protein [Chitinophagaceae bacterium]|nr:NAD(P)H-binding protein [Chitinophagaceae bacterium]
MERTAIILGATGLTGEQVVEKLLADDYFSRVRILVRKAYPHHHPRLEVHQVNFQDQPSWLSLMRGDSLFSCLGTTMKQVHGDRELYRSIDFDIPLQAARAAAAQGVKKLLVISSLGADPHSRFFYPKLKGELEVALGQLPFQSIHILRPSFLTGNRTDPRPLERFSQTLYPLIRPLLVGRLRKYRTIGSDIVAEVMVKLAKSGKMGKFVYDSDEIAALPFRLM